MSKGKKPPRDRLGEISPTKQHERVSPEERTRVAGRSVVRLSAYWMSHNPWVWKCPDCDNGFIACEEKWQAVSAALFHRETHK